jgi:hypothetical protein
MDDGPTTLEVVVWIVTASAALYGAILSTINLIYRASFWEGREQELRAIFAEIATAADILVGNEEDFQLALGIAGPEAGGAAVAPKIDSFKEMSGRVGEAYPNASYFRQHAARGHRRQPTYVGRADLRRRSVPCCRAARDRRARPDRWRRRLRRRRALSEPGPLSRLGVSGCGGLRSRQQPAVHRSARTAPALWPRRPDRRRGWRRAGERRLRKHRDTRLLVRRVRIGYEGAGRARTLIGLIAVSTPEEARRYPDRARRTSSRRVGRAPRSAADPGRAEHGTGRTGRARCAWSR